MPNEPITRAVDVAGVTIGYRTGGVPDGPPVVLLHGGGSSAATWDRFVARLAPAGYRVLAVDLRGHGRSARTASYPLVGFQDDVSGLLDVLALDRVALVGHSLGGHVASVIAQRQPDRVTRLILEEPPVPAPTRAEVRGMSLRRFLLPALAGLAVRRGFDRRALLSTIRQLRVPDPGWWDGLASIAARTLIVSGGPTSHIPPRRLAAVARAIPDARLVTIPVGHRVHSRDPEGFAAAVVPFLAAGHRA